MVSHRNVHAFLVSFGAKWRGFFKSPMTGSSVDEDLRIRRKAHFYRVYCRFNPGFVYPYIADLVELNQTCFSGTLFNVISERSSHEHLTWKCFPQLFFKA